MAILIRAVLPDVTTEQYDEFSAKLRAEAGDTFAGCLVHVCVAKESGLEIYDSGSPRKRWTGSRR
ncbi:hypothetical protein ACWGI0_25380 [Streptomyces sp. NPDC054802]